MEDFLFGRSVYLFNHILNLSGLLAIFFLISIMSLYQGNSQYDAFPSLIGICRSVSAKKSYYYCFHKLLLLFWKKLFCFLYLKSSL